MAVPWFMFDIDNKTLITSKPIPTGNISDVKSIVLTEQPVPGLGYEPISTGGFGNRKISFTIPLINRNKTIGNTLLLKQLDLLRHAVGEDFFSLSSQGQFARGPQVLYSWGTGSIPLVYFVSKCDFQHRTSLVNDIGFPGWTDCQIELILDQENPLYKVEEAFRKISAIAGSVVNTFNLIQSEIQGTRPY